MYRIAICDDDPVLVKIIWALIPEGYEVEVFSSGIDLLEANTKERYDLFFMDISMPEISGFEVAERLKYNENTQLLIFVTGHDSLVYDSFQWRPFDFVRKSNLRDDFEKAFKRAIKLLNQNNRCCSIIADEKNYDFVVQKALYVEVLGHIVTIHMEDTRGNIMLRTTMKKILPQLEKFGFVQTHKSFAVNIVRVARMEDEVLLDNGEKIPLSRNYKKEFKEKYLKYLRLYSE